MAMKHIKSLREYIEVLKTLGELQEVDKEVDWNLEIAAITRRCYETGAPAPLFNTIKEAEKGFRVLGASAGISRQDGHYLSRVAVSLGLDPGATGREIILALADARTRPGIAPKRVESGLCKENILFGDDVDLFRFPTPLMHEGDGGRYFNTLGTIVVQSPDKKWTNWSIARIMIVDKNRMTGIVHPLQHVGMVHKMWSDIGKPTPFALVQGCEPFLPFVSGMPLPPFLNEGDYTGAYFGEPVEVVKCETSDLEVPATAEIVIEGTISNTETAVEGPMGEYAGYMWSGPGIPQPVYNVTAMTFRNQPILPITVAGGPVDEDHTAWGLPLAAEALVQLREHGLPVTMTWVPLESAIHWLVVTVPKNWRQQINSAAGDFCRKVGDVIFAAKFGPQMPKILVMNDDIDPTNLRELVWAFATRCHPGAGEIYFNKELVSPLVAFLRSSEKHSGNTTKVVYNCLPPDEWEGSLPKRSAFCGSFPPEIQEKVLANWQAYGFTKS
jgi:4-hydroxy-3-polyprenylbenzoate decarboxylase